MLERAKKHFVTFLTGLILNLCLIQAVGAQVMRLDEAALADKHYKYVYQWYDPQLKPKGILIAIHGLTLHGLLYENLARHLAEEGILVLAPDLPGYGRRWQNAKNSPKEQRSRICYSQAQDELIELAQSAKSTYKGIPLFCLGESLGANLALHVAEGQSDLVDGVILCAPAIKLRMNLNPRTIRDKASLVIGVLNPHATVNLAPYIEDYISDDPSIAKTTLNDPLVRKRLSYRDMWQSYQEMQPVYKEASRINTSTAVLILQGSQDKILCSRSIINLLSNLNSNDQTVKWFKNRGHLMLEACQPKPDVLQTLDEWLKLHVSGQLLEAKGTQVIPVTSSIQQMPLDNNLIIRQ